MTDLSTQTKKDTCHTRRNRAAFSLIELVVVLTILAILTSVATTRMSAVLQRTSAKASNRGLENIREAILGPEFERDDSGRRTRSGFVADMGRLPRATLNATNRFDLSELLVKPNDVDYYAVRQADGSTNMVNGTSSSDYDPEVWVPCGWRGPYLVLPIGTEEIKDSWGVAYESPDRNELKDRLRGYGDTDVLTNGTPIYIVRHLGENGVRDPDTASGIRTENADQKIDLDISNTTLRLSLAVSRKNGELVNLTGTDVDATIRIYSPLGSRIICSKKSINNLGTSNTVSFDNLTPGPRILRVYYSGGYTNNTQPRTIVLQPGANFITETLIY